MAGPNSIADVRGLYVHIPFCESICHYCDFVKTRARADTKKAYLSAVRRELEQYVRYFASVKTLYIGGGTPSCLDDAETDALFSLLKPVFDTADLTEITVECNPLDVTPAYARRLKSRGVNRISLGIQTMQEKHLQALGRKHDARAAAQSISNVRAAGFENISVDLLFAMPGETLAEVQDDLSRITALAPEHISCYHLSVEEGTRLYVKKQRGELVETDEDLAAEMYAAVMDTLAANGYHQYEISSFAKPGRESGHNLIYWRNEDYLGIGCGAHSNVEQRRWHNHMRVKTYIDALKTPAGPIAEYYPFEGMKDALMMGLRLREGVDIDALKRIYGTDVFKQYPGLKDAIATGLLTYDHPRIALTRRGMFLGNCVFAVLEGDAHD